MFKLFVVVNVDWFFLSHRKDIALEAQKAGYNVTIVTKDTGKKKDIEALRDMYGENFKTGLCINITLQEALMIIPKERARVDAFRGLISFLKGKMGIELNIKSQKSKGGKQRNYL